MAAAIGVRGDYDAARLRELAKRSDDANQTRRLLALAAIYDGGSRTEAATMGGVGPQTGRDWVRSAYRICRVPKLAIDIVLEVDAFVRASTIKRCWAAYILPG